MMTTGTNISIGGGDGIRILNSNIYGCVSAGIYVQRGLNVDIKNNLIYDNGGQAIQLNPHNADLIVENVEITGNAIYDNGDNIERGGIAVINSAVFDTTYVNNVLIANNLIWGGAQDGILIGQSSPVGRIGGVAVYNNTIYSNDRYGILVVENADGFTDPIIRNNISYNNVSGNIGGAGSYTASNNIVADPSFVSITPTDDTFLTVDVPTAGYDTNPPVDLDYLGESRGSISPNIGAYENGTLTGNIYYLSPTGSDSTGDGSYDNPWFSPAKARKSTGAIAPGDTVVFKDGTYNYTPVLFALGYSADDSGVPGSPIVYRAENIGGAIIKFNCAGSGSAGAGIWFHYQSGASYITIDGLTVLNAGETFRIDDDHIILKNVKASANDEWPPNLESSTCPDLSASFFQKSIMA